MIFSQRNTPRWIIFLADVGISLFSLVLAYLVRFNFDIPQVEIDLFYWVFPIVVGVRAISFFISKVYTGIIRYTSSKDAQRIFMVVTVGSALFCLTNVGSWLANEFFIIPFSIIIIEYMATVFLMIAARIAVKVFYFELKNPSREKDKVVIFGAGDSGIITKRTIDRDERSSFKVIAFIDDDQRKAGKSIEGIPIHHSHDINKVLSNATISHMIISIQNFDHNRKREIIERALEHNVEVLNVPDVQTWINGELSFNQIQNIRIEDLLGRKPIKLDEKKIKEQVAGRVVLVTGAAGSIGSEIVRQIAKFEPGKIILLDQSESPLYELHWEMQNRRKGEMCEVVIGDVRNWERMENLFNTMKPEVVYHAAAYKHVPLMEHNPSEAMRTNILGTRTIVDLSVQYGVKDFVMVSTDKAVNPTNVMGASKRLAEIYVQAISKTSDTRFVTTRFGNVLGSSGSVIPLFKKQIEEGGPVMVTDAAVTRFFMTIPEACQLVLEAGAMGQGGEIFVFDMGERIRILDLAKKMIKLAGLRLGKDIEIKFTGLRPGEKLHEELLADEENTTKTHHPQIMIAKVRQHDYEKVNADIEALIALYAQQDNTDIVKRMKELVPEYVSENSEFAKFDN